MANDRVFLVSKATGERLCLFKFWSAYRITPWWHEEDLEDIEAFILRGLKAGQADDVTLKGDPRFFLETESDPDE
jgi:hypothetical protein